MQKLVLALVVALPALAQRSSTDGAVHASNKYRMIPNVTYLTASNIELKLDLYQRSDVTTPQPTVIHMHGANENLCNYPRVSREERTRIEMTWVQQLSNSLSAQRNVVPRFVHQ
ncbi:MAG: hypothetical protein ABI833_21965 [Acidobacteriota bacterium]